jgi:nicotinamidase-related amidase
MRDPSTPAEDALVIRAGMHCPARSSVVLLIVDMINDLNFPGGDALLHNAQPAARRIAALAERARAARVPVLYVNDNFGLWRSDLQATVEHVRRSPRGRLLLDPLHPRADDYFVLKPKHSGFYATPLELLLAHLGARRLVMTGITTNQCILFTAYDAHMRNYRLTVPADCVASCTPTAHQEALALMRDSLSADTTASDRLDLDALVADARAA